MRYKEFNVNRVLDKCINQFWIDGYENTSIQQLVDVTNVNRFSLYNEFENKHGILLATIDRYRQQVVINRVAILESASESALEQSRKFFYAHIEDQTDHPEGCYLFTVATELADKDAEVHKILQQYLKILEEAFLKAFLAEFETNDAEFITRHLVGLFCASMCFCLIQDYGERKTLIDNGLKVITNKFPVHA